MNNQNNQLILTTEAMAEAVHHMIDLLGACNIQDFNQVLSSYVTALKAIQPHVEETKDKLAIQLLENIQKDILLSIHDIKQDSIEKSLHRFQTLIEPNSLKLHEQVSEAMKKRKTIIGIYHAENNPILSYNNNRLTALYKEAERQNCDLYMFESKDVDMKSSKIKALYSLDTKEKVEIKLPDVIYNIFPKINYVHDDVEKWLRKRAPFSTFPINNKVDLPRKIADTSHLGDLFLPYTKLMTASDVFKCLESHKQAVLKKYAASRGESIYFIEEKSRNDYEVIVSNEVKKFKKKAFKSWLEKHIVNEKFIIQQYKEFKTKDNEPYDIRAHMQKNGEGKWVITKMYPRIGMKDTIISNISRGGRTEDLFVFLIEKFNDEKAAKIKGRLEELSVEIVQTIDGIYEGSIDELGLDLAIDEDEKIWMHEANLKPRIRHHEAERAINTIGYLKYLACKQLFLTNELQRI